MVSIDREEQPHRPRGEAKIHNMRNLRATSTVIISLLAAGCTARAAPELADHHPKVAHLVVNLMEYEHYEPKKIDDDFSAAWLEAYLERLDPAHMIFLQSDVDEFQKYGTQLDDMVRQRKPDLSAGLDIYGRYQDRLAERTAAVERVLSGDIDLHTDDTWVLEDDPQGWPQSAAAADELWRKRITNDVLISELQDEQGIDRSREEIVESIRKRYDRKLKDVQSSGSADMLGAFLSAFSETFDPHSTYFKPADDDNFAINMSNSLEGIGARLKVDGDYTVVEDVIPGGPAALDGELQKGDRIIAVAQGRDKPEDIIGMRLDRVVAQIRGKKGTEVRLTVIPVDEPDQTRIIDITRDEVLLSESDAEGEVIEKDGRRYGLIEVPSFYIDQNRPLPGGGYYGASADVKRLVGELEAQDIDGLILDLRGNGGGSLSEAVAMAGLFIDRGPIVQVRDRDNTTEVLDDPDPSLVYDGPMVVLTDALSASASEIVAGALQDYGRAVVVGAEQTHGKGTVQRVVDLDYFLSQAWGVKARSGGLKLTIQKFYRVSGGSTQNRGVHSDIVLPSYWDGLDLFESDLDNALAYDEIDAARFRRVGDVSAVLPALREKSAARVAESEPFQELIEYLSEREADQSRSALSLNIDTRRQELKKDSEEEDESPSADADDRSKDFILQEGAAVLGDWITLQGS